MTCRPETIGMNVTKLNTFNMTRAEGKMYSVLEFYYFFCGRLNFIVKLFSLELLQLPYSFLDAILLLNSICMSDNSIFDVIIHGI